MFYFLNNYSNNSNDRNKIGFEDVKIAISNQSKYVIINTLSSDLQNILIKNTTPCNEEETIINKIFSDYTMPDLPIIIYGTNYCDKTIEKKYDQIIKFGHSNVFIYYGGLFEWLLLNELYGNEEFPLNKDHNSIDILLYRPSSTFTNLIN